MKKKIREIALFIMFFPIVALAQNYGDYKLYATYDFENNSNDKQGNTALQLQNGATITTDAVRGKVLTFNHTQRSYAYFDPAPVIGETITLSFWFKRSSSDPVGPWKQIFEFHNPTDHANIYLMPEDGWGATTSMLVSDTKSYFSDVWQSTAGTKIEANNAWHHIVVVLDKTRMAYYLDGKFQSETCIAAPLTFQNPQRLYLGFNPNRGNYIMSGSMDDVKVFHYPLSASQIKQVYNGEEITDPATESGDNFITFHFDGNLNETSNKISLSGTSYSLINNDPFRKEVVSIQAGGQLNFSEELFPAGSSTVNFLYKKESFSEADNGKYIYQCSNDNNSYGLKLKVTGSDAVLVLENKINGTLAERAGTIKLEKNEWNAISVFYSVSEGSDKGTMRIYQNAQQTTALANVQTYTLNFDKWSIGATNAAQSAGGLYDELEVVAHSMTVPELTAYYKSNTIVIDVLVNLDAKKQTIRNFGASDAWATQLIGNKWPLERKNELAELLFSKEFDNNGNPKGIGLSCWRFNIGAGSSEQGDAGGIYTEGVRTECFLKSDGTYDWNKQAGQQWFLKKAAKDYQVEDIIGFMNSPPVYFNRDGVAFNKNGDMSYILLPDKYDDYAKFTADVVEHFESEEGILFDYISPLNEPQYQWTNEPGKLAGQEGSPATDTEISNVVKAMSHEFDTRKLKTQIFIGEAGSIDNAAKQVPVFWGDANPSLKISHLPNVAYAVSAHSYWNDGSATDMVNERKKLRSSMDNVSPDLEFFQTEYCLLGEGFLWGHSGKSGDILTEMESGISLARMLHVDFAVANATAWQWWTTFEGAKQGGWTRYALIEALTNKDASNTYYNDCKLLYTLGQYSRFVRPGMTRVELSRSDNMSEIDALSNQMFTAYFNEEANQLVIIATNTLYGNSNIKLNVDGVENLEFTPYITSEGKENNMKALPNINMGDNFVMPPLSVVTFVSSPVNRTNIDNVKRDVVTLELYPNPVNDYINLKSESNIESASVYDMQGRNVKTQVFDPTKQCQISVFELSKGLYLLKIKTAEGYITKKVLKN